MLSLISAFTNNRVIGNKNQLPWKIPLDKTHFNRITNGATIIMGRNTYESIYSHHQSPLINRRNIVVSTTLKSVPDGFELVSNLRQALAISNATSPDEEVFIVGGSGLYKYCLDHSIIDHMYLTKIDADISGDRFFPEYDERDWLEISKKVVPKGEGNPYNLTFVVLVRKDYDSKAIELL
jgi:dihydrofolate reductase